MRGSIEGFNDKSITYAATYGKPMASTNDKSLTYVATWTPQAYLDAGFTTARSSSVSVPLLGTTRPTPRRLLSNSMRNTRRYFRMLSDLPSVRLRPCWMHLTPRSGQSWIELGNEKAHGFSVAEAELLANDGTIGKLFRALTRHVEDESTSILGTSCAEHNELAARMQAVREIDNPPIRTTSTRLLRPKLFVLCKIVSGAASLRFCRYLLRARSIHLESHHHRRAPTILPYHTTTILTSTTSGRRWSGGCSLLSCRDC